MATLSNVISLSWRRCVHHQINCGHQHHHHQSKNSTTSTAPASINGRRMQTRDEISHTGSKRPIPLTLPLLSLSLTLLVECPFRTYTINLINCHFKSHLLRSQLLSSCLCSGDSCYLYVLLLLLCTTAFVQPSAQCCSCFCSCQHHHPPSSSAVIDKQASNCVSTSIDSLFRCQFNILHCLYW